MKRIKIATDWLPDSLSAGGYHAYGNTLRTYDYAARVHLSFNATERFAASKDRPWIKAVPTMAVDRRTFKVLDAMGKSPSKKLSKPRVK